MKCAPFIFLLFLTSTFNSCHLLSAAGLSSQGLPVKEASATLSDTYATNSPRIDHTQWTKLLQKHVNEAGLVDYKGFKKDQEALNAYAKKLSDAQPDKSWSVEELLAYYINIYNVFTVKLILDNYPVNSIQDISGAFTKAFIPIGNKKLSLGGIENGILRKMNEPRIHFAINCASISCPKLANTAYSAATINEQLDTATRDFINSNKNNLQTNELKISKIFQWYEKDFITKKTPTIVDYINTYTDEKLYPESPVSYKEYDWKLNKQD